jgi:hypothetical protein
MPSQQEISATLRASRVVPLRVDKPHGPLGLEHLAATVARVTHEGGTHKDAHKGIRDIYQGEKGS